MAIECYDGNCRFHQPDEPFCCLDYCQQCPSCSNVDYILEHHYEKVKINGSGKSKVKCVYCGAIIEVFIRRQVISSITTSEVCK